MPTSTTSKSSTSKSKAAAKKAPAKTVKKPVVAPVVTEPVALAKQPESRFVKGLLVLAVLAIAGFAAWYIFDTRQKVDELYSAGDRSSSLVAGDITVQSSKLPAGWTVKQQGDGTLSVVNNDNNCAVNAAYSRNVNQQAGATTDPAAQKVGSSEVSLSTSNGAKVVTADTVKIDGADGTTYQQNAVDASGQAVTSAQLTCNNASDLTNAQAALQAITFNAEF